MRFDERRFAFLRVTHEVDRQRHERGGVVHKCVWGWYTGVYPRPGAIDNLQQVMINDVLITPMGAVTSSEVTT